MENYYLTLLITCNVLNTASCLTGHVCSRQKAETYQTTYDRAFICPERYTTACGQLDWRRCTKYRVNTCYTPTQKYEIRYYTVEECCPGWKDAGGGDCSSPVCWNMCENGGICDVTANGKPVCACSEPYYGDQCQYRKVALLYYVAIAAGVVAVFTVIVLLACICNVKQRWSYKNRIECMQLKELNKQEAESLLSSSSEGSSQTDLRDRKMPTAPQED